VIDTIPFVLGLIVTCIAFVVAFSRLLDPEMGGGLRGLLRSITPRVVASAAVAWLLMATLPWVGGLVSDRVDGFLVAAGILLGMAGAFVVARQFPPGWSSFVAVLVLVGCVWVGGYALYIACASGWQDMSVEDIGGGDGEPPWTVIAILAIGTIVAPLPGLLIGILARRPTPKSPSA
jgi:hypothetical protein